MRLCWTTLALVAGATLVFGPISAQQPESPLPPPNPEAPPYYKSLTLEGEFKTDPFPIGVVAGGHYSVSRMGRDCIGNITAERPDVTVEFKGGKRPLTLYAAAASDTSLLVHTPGGQWLCADDTTDGGMNPALTFDRPENGTYAVWVASVDTSSRPVPAVLAISEFAPSW